MNRITPRMITHVIALTEIPRCFGQSCYFLLKDGGVTQAFAHLASYINVLNYDYEESSSKIFRNVGIKSHKMVVAKMTSLPT
jgi:hypothetical protein